jgi:4-amino-4-deoxy-L-arabinose transferase-like glycosyltransferase
MISSARGSRLWWIAAVFLAVQIWIISLAANGPFVDEGLYTVAGMRVLEGQGLADGYLAWFNGSPFVWPVIAALGHRLGGLSGARLMAALLCTVALVAFAHSARNLFGEPAAVWGALALSINGLFMALAHFAVYDVAALAGLAVSMWCLTCSSPTASSRCVVGAAIAFAGAVIAKYGSILMVAPLLGLLVSMRGFRRSRAAVAGFLSVAGVILAAYFLLAFESLFPTSSGAYLEQAFGRSRGHILALQVVFAVAPLLLASVGAVIAWQRRQRGLVVTCLVAMLVYPSFHLGSGNFVSAQKHVVAGFLFAYLLAGVALERLWSTRARVTLVTVLAVLVTWGGLQCYWQDRSWSDSRALARYLASHMRSGDRVVAESSWAYILYLYPSGLIGSPADVIDANYPPRHDQVDVCRIPWLVGNPHSASMIRAAVERCRHEEVFSAVTQQYYLDTARLRLGVSPVVVGLYRLPRP